MRWAEPIGAILADVVRDLGLAKKMSEQRAVVVLSDIQGMSYDEVSDTLDVALGTVKSRLHHARERLRAALEV